MLGVTVGSGNQYEAMAVHAAASVQAHAKIPTVILKPDLRAFSRYHRNPAAAAAFARLHVFDWFSNDVFYFDADTMLLKRWAVGQLAGRPELIAVRDAFASSDAQRLGMPEEEYFNSGMLILNSRHHRPMLELAQEMAMSGVYAESPFFDQTCLNAARWALGIPLLLLDDRYNYIAYGARGRPSTVILAHPAGGFGNEKGVVLQDLWESINATVASDADVRAGVGHSLRAVRPSRSARLIRRSRRTRHGRILVAHG